MQQNEGSQMKRTPISSILDMLEQRAQDGSNATAFVYHVGRKNIGQKTFFEVNQDARLLAQWIINTHGTGNHIAIVGETSYEWILCFFAIVISGNVAVLVNQDLPVAEVTDLTALADVSLAFCSPVYADLVEENPSITSYRMNKLETLMQTIDPTAIRLEEPCKDDLACIFFTSGTTGKPKGVMLSHGNLTAGIDLTCDMYYLRPGGKTLTVLPLYHAFCLIVAVCMVYDSYGCNYLNKSLKNLQADLAWAQPNLMFMVPLFVETFYKRIFATAKKEGKEKALRLLMKLSNILLRFGIDKRRSFFKDIHAQFGGHLEDIICGGAVLSPFYVQEFTTFGISLLNGYGTTECSPVVAINRLEWNKSGTVGELVPQSEGRVADDGEVQIHGPHVMMGYYKNPEATAEVLQDGWYATGDIGFFDKDGFLTLTGRKKNLIILSNGENISPEELENDFGKDLAVDEVLVYGESSQIIAEIVPAEEYQGNTEYFEKLKDAVNAGRPLNKQVAQVRLRTEKFPRNASNKIIRQYK